jgi:hypothetical protein
MIALQTGDAIAGGRAVLFSLIMIRLKLHRASIATIPVKCPHLDHRPLLVGSPRARGANAYALESDSATRGCLRARVGLTISMPMAGRMSAVSPRARGADSQALVSSQR